MFTQKNTKTKLHWWLSVLTWYIGIGYGGILIGFSGNALLMLMIGIMLLTLIGWMFLNQKHYDNFVKELDSLSQELHQSKDYDMYICQHEKMVNDCTHIPTLAIVYLNIAEAYFEKQDYTNGVVTLEKLRINEMSGLLKTRYCITQAYMMFYQGQHGNAVALLEENASRIEKAKDNPTLADMILVNKVFTALYKGELDVARNILDTHEYRCKDHPKHNRDYVYLMDLLVQREEKASFYKS